MSKQCAYCNKDLPGGARFCGHCGKEQKLANENNVKAEDGKKETDSSLSAIENEPTKSHPWYRFGAAIVIF